MDKQRNKCANEVFQMESVDWIYFQLDSDREHYVRCFLFNVKKKRKENGAPCIHCSTTYVAGMVWCIITVTVINFSRFPLPSFCSMITLKVDAVKIKLSFALKKWLVWGIRFWKHLWKNIVKLNEVTETPFYFHSFLIIII